MFLPEVSEHRLEDFMCVWIIKQVNRTAFQYSFSILGCSVDKRLYVRKVSIILLVGGHKLLVEVHLQKHRWAYMRQFM